MHRTERRHATSLPAHVIPLLAAAIGSSSLFPATRAGLPPSPTEYQFTPVIIPDASWVFPIAIANDSTVSGFFYDSQSTSHGFLWRDGHVTVVDAPGWRNTQFTGMNDRGIVTGLLDNGNIVGLGMGVAACVYNTQDNSWNILPEVPGRPVFQNILINNKGLVYGCSSQGDYQTPYDTIAWTWDGQAYSFFSPPGASPSGLGALSLGINDHDQLSGFYQDALGAFRGFLVMDSVVTTVDVPGADWTQVWGLNNRGDLVGAYVAGDQLNGFIRRNGQFYTLPTPENTTLFAINDHGQLVGVTYDESGFHGFLATPAGSSSSRKP